MKISNFCGLKFRARGQIVFLSYQIRSEGSLCREKVNDCDLPEFCDGKSPIVSLS